MDYNSILRTIASSLASNGHTHLRIVEQNRVGHLAASGVEKPRGEGDYTRPRLKDYRCSVFPFLSYIFALAGWALYNVWIFLLYYVPALGNKTRARRLAGNIRYNFIVVTTAVVMFIVMTVLTLSYFISDVVLFSRPAYSNAHGTLVIEQPFHRNYHMFLFNTALYWNSTGIEISPGDRIHITGSGSFFSDISEQSRAALVNEKSDSLGFVTANDVKTDRFSPSKAMKEARVLPDTTFGALLYRIVPDIIDENDSTAIRKLELSTGRPAVITADRAGVLQFCVNDIYFHDRNIESLIHDAQGRGKLVKKLKVESGNIDDSLRIKMEANRRLWFDDNNGEILLNITVDYNLDRRRDVGSLDKFYAKVFRPVNNIVNPPVREMSIFSNPGSWIFISIFMIAGLIDFTIGYRNRRRHTR